MTLNGVIALILRYFTEFDRSGRRLYVTVVVESYKVRCRIASSSYILAKTDPRSSRIIAWSLCDS